MSDLNEKEISTEETLVDSAVEPTLSLEDDANPVVSVVAPTTSEDDRGGRRRFDRKKNERKSSRRPEKVRQEFDNKLISIRRVTRVVSGGRRFSFSAAIVVGDRKGRVGVGLGKAGDTPIAVEKAVRDAKKNMVRINLNKKGSIPHQVEAKYSSSVVVIMPAPGKGVIAGSSVRTVLELAGIKEVSTKILSRSKNKINIARATVKALSKIRVQE